MEHVSEFKYLGYVIDEPFIDDAESRRNVSCGRMVAGAIRFLQLESARVLHETLLMRGLGLWPQRFAGY